MSSDTPLSTRAGPKKTERSCTVTAAASAEGAGAEPSLGSGLSSAVTGVCFSSFVVMAGLSMAVLSVAVPRQQPHTDVDGGDQHQQYERPCPGLSVPVIVGGNRVAENLQRQRGDRIGQ